jgi:hypothetical protein
MLRNSFLLIKIKEGSHGWQSLSGVSVGVSELISSSTFRTLNLTIVSFDELIVIFEGCNLLRLSVEYVTAGLFCKQAG